MQVYPGLAVSLLGGADANTQQVKADDSCRVHDLFFAFGCMAVAVVHTLLKYVTGATAASAEGLGGSCRQRLAIARSCCVVMLAKRRRTDLVVMSKRCVRPLEVLQAGPCAIFVPVEVCVQRSKIMVVPCTATLVLPSQGHLCMLPGRLSGLWIDLKHIAIWISNNYAIRMNLEPSFFCTQQQLQQRIADKASRYSASLLILESAV